ncbi:MAG: acyl carrier protein [Prolixibacteraceae bacterium]|jgi:acyl carrier protein
MNDILQIQEKVKEFILKTSYISGDQIANETLIFAQGIMDSMGFISIIGFIEETFSITAGDNDLLEENFESINAISNFVHRKLHASVNEVM